MWASPERRELVFRTEDQEQIEVFQDFSKWGYRATYTGIALPVNVVNCEYLDINGRRVPIESGPIENVKFGNYAGHHRPVATRRITKSSLRHDIPYNNKAVVVFRCEDPADNGSRVGVEYVTRDGSVVREDILVNTSGPETSKIPVYFTKITFPERQGWIKVTTADGFSLGSYHPSVTSPQHIRIQIDGCFPAQIVKWVALQEPMDVVFDSDLVEVAQEFDWIQALKWAELHLKTTKSPEELKTYAALASFSASSVASELKADQGSPSVNLRPRNTRTTFHRLRSLNAKPARGPGLGWRNI
jgi:hypothetical protein